MTTLCPFCHKEVDSGAKDTWKAVQGWVGGPRKDSMRFRVDTGEYAHDSCIGKAQAERNNLGVDSTPLF